MSNSGVNAGFAKCFIFFMATVILIQGGAYLGLAIWGITLENCSEEITDIATKPFQFAVDLIYFLKEECGTPTATLPELENTEVGITIDWAKSYLVTNRMNIFMYTYAAVSACWVITSLLVITTICGPVTKIKRGLCFWPWFLVVIAGSILDVVATYYHVTDIIHTTSAEETFDYVGVSVPDKVFQYFDNFSAYFVTPAVVMTCISSRVVLIWLLNIFGTSFCLSLSHVLSKRNASQTPQPFITPASSTVTASIRTEIPAQLSAQPQLQSELVIKEQYPPQIKPKPLQIALLESPMHRQNSQSERSVQSPVAIYPSAPTPEAATTYRSTDTHPDRLDYPSQQSPSQSSPQQQQLSAVSPLNNRYSTTEGFPYQNQGQPQRVSHELRSQLPWSYTSMQTAPPQTKPPPPTQPKPTPPRKPQQVQIYPEIPEPDYIEQDGPAGGEGNDPQTQQSYSRW